MNELEIATKLHELENQINELLKEAGKTNLRVEFRDYGCISEDHTIGWQQLELTITQKL